MGNEIEVEVEIESESEVPANADDLQRWWLSYSSSSSSSPSSSSSSVPEPLPQLSLNHVSFVCKSVAESVRFYEDILGFVLIKGPSSFNFEGARLFNYGIGIHLLESKNVKGDINPKDNHISFQFSDLKLLEQRLERMGIDYVTAAINEGGIHVDQMYFHDPDGYMVEICNCDNLPISSCPLKQSKPSTPTTYHDNSQGSDTKCAVQVSAMMMENLLIDMFDISI